MDERRIRKIVEQTFARIEKNLAEGKSPYAGFSTGVERRMAQVLKRPETPDERERREDTLVRKRMYRDLRKRSGMSKEDVDAGLERLRKMMGVGGDASTDSS